MILVIHIVHKYVDNTPYKQNTHTHTIWTIFSFDGGNIITSPFYKFMQIYSLTFWSSFSIKSRERPSTRTLQITKLNKLMTRSLAILISVNNSLLYMVVPTQKQLQYRPSRPMALFVLWNLVRIVYNFDPECGRWVEMLELFSIACQGLTGFRMNVGQ